MKIIHLISIVFALALCITPVAAVSADDFKVEVVNDKHGFPLTYTYLNQNDPDEKYTRITTDSTRYSFVTFKPVGIKGAPVMIVNTTNKNADIYLPCCFNAWYIKYYYYNDSSYSACFKMTPDVGPEWLSDDDD